MTFTDFIAALYLGDRLRGGGQTTFDSRTTARGGESGLFGARHDEKRTASLPAGTCRKSLIMI